MLDDAAGRSRTGRSYRSSATEMETKIRSSDSSSPMGDADLSKRRSATRFGHQRGTLMTNNDNCRLTGHSRNFRKARTRNQPRASELCSMGNVWHFVVTARCWHGCVCCVPPNAAATAREQCDGHSWLRSEPAGISRACRITCARFLKNCQPSRAPETRRSHCLRSRKRLHWAWIFALREVRESLRALC